MAAQIPAIMRLPERRMKPREGLAENIVRIIALNFEQIN
jgi:hypothetical protein